MPRPRTGLVFVLVAAFGCGGAAVERGQVEGIKGLISEAERSGARKCAPRELSEAKAHVEFARTELDQGELFESRRHLFTAETNARAALLLSPAEKCQADAYVALPQPGDRDGDGIPDTDDKCPAEPENYNTFEDTDGCPDDPDTDGDKIPDSVDHCILQPEDMDGYLDDDGCPERDNDADGVVDAADKCPNQPEDPDGFEDSDGCPEPDNDKDGVADLEDFCPLEPGLPGGERPGCPKKDAAVIVTANEIRITQQIQFEFNKATIKKASYGILDAVRDVLKANSAIKLEVQGHTDNVGNAEYNRKLSQSRADAVRAYLIDHGIEATRLTAKGYGPSQPIAPNTNEKGRSQNRRVQFIRTEAQGK